MTLVENKPQRTRTEQLTQSTITPTRLSRNGNKNHQIHTLPRTTVSLFSLPPPPGPHFFFPFYPASPNDQGGNSCWSKKEAITWLKKAEKHTNTHTAVTNTFYMQFLNIPINAIVILNPNIYIF